MKQTSCKGAIFGLVVGDALGVPFEFKRRGTFQAADMVGGGTYELPAGTWSDDSSMAIATLESIGRLARVDCNDIIKNFYRWFSENEFTPYGEVFDIGIATRNALQRYQWGTPPSECGGKGERDNGNGSLMRIIPLAFTDCGDEDVKNVSALTHAHEISRESCRVYISFARDLLAGKSVKDAIEKIDTSLPQLCRLKEIAKQPQEEIRSSGYVVDTLEAALWCLANTDSYSDCVLAAVNLGEDTDTVAAVAGGLAGIVYGYDGIPQEWLAKIARREWILALCEKFDTAVLEK